MLPSLQPQVPRGFRPIPEEHDPTRSAAGSTHAANTSDVAMRGDSSGMSDTPATGRHALEALKQKGWLEEGYRPSKPIAI